MIYTSYWQSPLLAEVDAVPVGISRGKPRWRLPFKYRVAAELAPSDRTWALDDWDAFTTSYLGQLETLGSGAILDRLAGIGDGRAVVCLCWESDPSGCHRRMLASYLEREAGIVVPELLPGMLPERDGVPQPRLF